MERSPSTTQSQLAIPAGATEYKASQQFVFDKDNTTEDLLSVPNYNFAWQPTYRMANPRVLPAGSRVVVSGAFDNSKYNLGNPDPSKDITWGLQSWDEMFIGYFAYHNLEKDSR